jgi:FAD/FMN-containing dehydrogenase
MLNAADADFLNALEAALPANTLRGPEPRFLEEPRGRYAGQAAAVAMPRSTAEVATIVRACSDARVGIIPYGGGTGLVGGQLMSDGPAPLVISLERMASVRAVYPDENILLADAGVILADVQAAAAGVGRMFGLSLASEGSARVGGILSTNAGGTGVVRYGNTRDLCLGLEVVLADGTIWNGLKRLRKDNTGYDLRNLLIGSEGTLGIITGASLRLHPRPASQGAALLVVKSPAAALKLFALAQSHLAEGISAFELIGGMGLHFLAETLPGLRQPFAVPPDWMVLIDVGLAQGLHPTDVLSDLFEAALDADLVQDGVIAQSEGQRRDFWAIRETIPTANRMIGAISSHDISVPLGSIAEFITRATAALTQHGSYRINCFGHLGDGNLHFNVFPMPGRSKADHLDERDDIKRIIHDLTDELGGSVSAEHGIGRLKVADLQRYGDPVKLTAMRAIKAALDPLGIMNPGALLPSQD